MRDNIIDKIKTLYLILKPSKKIKKNTKPANNFKKFARSPIKNDINAKKTIGSNIKYFLCLKIFIINPIKIKKIQENILQFLIHSP